MSRKATVLCLGVAVVPSFALKPLKLKTAISKGGEIGGLYPLVRDTEFGKVQRFHRWFRSIGVAGNEDCLYVNIWRPPISHSQMHSTEGVYYEFIPFPVP